MALSARFSLHLTRVSLWLPRDSSSVAVVNTTSHSVSMPWFTLLLWLLLQPLGIDHRAEYFLLLQCLLLHKLVRSHIILRAGLVGEFLVSFHLITKCCRLQLPFQGRALVVDTHCNSKRGLQSDVRNDVLAQLEVIHHSGLHIRLVQIHSLFVVKQRVDIHDHHVLDIVDNLVNLTGGSLLRNRLEQYFPVELA